MFLGFSNFNITLEMAGVNASLTVINSQTKRSSVLPSEVNLGVLHNEDTHLGSPTFGTPNSGVEGNLGQNTRIESLISESDFNSIVDIVCRSGGMEH